mmetsp:Transcript_34647/g.75829  ORF Transcript_34647/g.75829 Transcript_34647/m.75829 type:complete len:211 (-) Transcript_34647:1444-2076(-)
MLSLLSRDSSSSTMAWIWSSDSPGTLRRASAISSDDISSSVIMSSSLMSILLMASSCSAVRVSCRASISDNRFCASVSRSKASAVASPSSSRSYWTNLRPRSSTPSILVVEATPTASAISSDISSSASSSPSSPPDSFLASFSCFLASFSKRTTSSSFLVLSVSLSITQSTSSSVYRYWRGVARMSASASGSRPSSHSRSSSSPALPIAS